MVPMGTNDQGVSVYFRSAFYGTRRQKNMVHRKLAEAIRERGFLRPGEEPIPHIEVIDFESEETSWDTVGTLLLSQVQEWTTRLEKIKEPKDYDHYVNPETGQKIFVKELMFATTIWPLEEVLEMVPAA